jgi:hypothetical protein
MIPTSVPTEAEKMFLTLPKMTYSNENQWNHLFPTLLIWHNGFTIIKKSYSPLPPDQKGEWP